MLYIAEDLKTLRKGKNLTQEGVRELFGLSARCVSKWKRGAPMPDAVLANLYKVREELRRIRIP